MEKTFDVVAVGTLNVDLIVIGEAPRELEALNHWVSASQVALTAAGSVGYCAIDLARLGLRVSLLSSVAALTLKGMGGTQTAPSLTQVQTFLNTRDSPRYWRANTGGCP
ncbi:MAG: hypothetical protein A2V67_07450 [Deltaproteobacteria bacterium RBG_13_61_14]|nr:MAG: hypothetical protein A2V67_07450 [Deltaproteobacteria bacterium RBG_13_61_14]